MTTQSSPSPATAPGQTALVAACPLCGTAPRRWLRVPCDWRRADAVAYALHWCDDCALGQLQPRPTAEELIAAYAVDGYYTHGAEARRSRKPNLLDRLRVHIAWRCDGGRPLIDAVNQEFPPPPARVLDVGCGNGTLAAALRDRGYDVTGVEPDPAARAVAAGRGLTVFAGTAEQLPTELAGRVFDVVVMSHVLEHCVDPLAALHNAAALLAATGRLVVEVPNNEAIGLSRAGATWSWLDVPRHVNFFTTGSLMSCCRRAGLAHVSTAYAGYCRQLNNDWIETEQRIWDRFAELAPPVTLPPRNGAWRAWGLLLRTAWAAPARKYDSVRIVAVRSQTGAPASR